MPKTIKITLFALLTSLIFISNGFCVPALQIVQQVEQPDGYSFSAKRWGDERGHGWETTDGYTIVKDPATKYWHYATTNRTTQQATAGLIVGTAPAPANLEKHQRPGQTALSPSYRTSAVQDQPKAIERTPVSGSRPVPVLMINFNNTATTYDAADFDDLLFGTGNGSMKDYYEQVSYGEFTITAGDSGVTGWHTASKSLGYYGANIGSGYDKHPGELVIEAVAAADATVDYAEYDTDGDCYVDAVVVIHQGAGEEAGGSSDTIWSHRWNLNSAAYYGDGNGQYTTNDTAACGQIVINDYVLQPETLLGGIQTIGVFAHEYGHVLGLPDLYDIDYSSSGIGGWGLMSNGAWGSISRPGDSPVHLCAWSKYVLGWIDPVTITEKRVDEKIDPAGTHDDVYLFLPGDQNDGYEYYLIENRQLVGFDAGLPGAGLAIWHIDEAMATYNNRDNSQECAPSTDCIDTHYRVALIQADGYRDLETGYNRGDRGDLYPGTSANTSFTSSSAPSSLLYDGSSSHVGVYDITESGDTIFATFARSYAITPSVEGNGSITPGSTTSIHHGETRTFTILPHQGYQISEVYVDDVLVGSVAEYTFSDTQLDHQIRAVFTAADGQQAAASSGGGGSGGGCFIFAMFE